MLVSFKGAQPQQIPNEHEGKTETELNQLGFVICPEKPSIEPGQKLWWENNQWYILDPNEAEIALKWVEVRNKRDELLKESDIFITRSQEEKVPVDVGVKQYRQALRDITDQPNPFTIEWPNRPIYENGRWIGTILTVTDEAVDQERDRRIDAGFYWNTYLVQCDQDSREKLTGAAASAVFYLMQGGDANTVYWASPTEPFQWILFHNNIVTLTPLQLIDMALTGMAHTKAHIFHARILKNMQPIPSDFIDDKYWPIVVPVTDQ